MPLGPLHQRRLTRLQQVCFRRRQHLQGLAPATSITTGPTTTSNCPRPPGYSSILKRNPGTHPIDDAYMTRRVRDWESLCIYQITHPFDDASTTRRVRDWESLYTYKPPPLIRRRLHDDAQYIKAVNSPFSATRLQVSFGRHERPSSLVDTCNAPIEP